MARNAYSPEERREALELYEEHGPAEAARRTGIERGTISSWARRSGLVSGRREKTQAATEAARLAWAARRSIVANELGDLATDLIEKVRTTQPRYVRNVALALSVAIEKAELLSGFATERRETVPAADLEARTRELRDELAQRREQRESG